MGRIARSGLRLLLKQAWTRKLLTVERQTQKRMTRTLMLPEPFGSPSEKEPTLYASTRGI